MFYALRNHLQLRLLPDPRRDLEMFTLGGLEAGEILPQGVLIELGQELRADRGVQLADFVDELTFVHDRLTFGLLSGCGDAYRARNHS